MSAFERLLEQKAVALQYSPEKDSAPVIVASGMGYMAEKITEGVKNLLSQAKHVVIVTNEIFSDGILYEEESEQYKKELGQINQKLAEMAEEVVEVVYGIPVWHKGGKET